MNFYYSCMEDAYDMTLTGTQNLCADHVMTKCLVGDCSGCMFNDESCSFQELFKQCRTGECAGCIYDDGCCKCKEYLEKS